LTQAAWRQHAALADAEAAFLLYDLRSAVRDTFTGTCMKAELDPYRHHPFLRDEIVDPLRSDLRFFSASLLAERVAALGLSSGWWYSDEEREELRMQALGNRLDDDLWVFAYGSLMWDPAFRFAEVRRASVADYSRQFILKDIHGGRGTVEAPGLMAALDKGTGCDGLAFRIPREIVNEETEILWRREQVGPAYLATFVTLEVADATISALTFVADHDAEIIDATLTREEQIRFLATGTGFLGSSLDYLKNIEKKFAALGIRDDEIAALVHDVEAYAESG
jgi:glutathione-specific gamma-glutamylcyclotransferase